MIAVLSVLAVKAVKTAPIFVLCAERFAPPAAMNSVLPVICAGCVQMIFSARNVTSAETVRRCARTAVLFVPTVRKAYVMIAANARDVLMYFVPTAAFVWTVPMPCVRNAISVETAPTCSAETAANTARTVPDSVQNAESAKTALKSARTVNCAETVVRNVRKNMDAVMESVRKVRNGRSITALPEITVQEIPPKQIITKVNTGHCAAKAVM